MAEATSAILPLNRYNPEHNPMDKAYVDRLFAYQHLPPELQGVSLPFAELAAQVVGLPANPERTVALRKLLEAKDAAVRAKVMGPMPDAAPPRRDPKA
jgi:hypothetical protein